MRDCSFVKNWMHLRSHQHSLSWFRSVSGGLSVVRRVGPRQAQWMYNLYTGSLLKCIGISSQEASVQRPELPLSTSCILVTTGIQLGFSTIPFAFHLFGCHALLLTLERWALGRTHSHPSLESFRFLRSTIPRMDTPACPCWSRWIPDHGHPRGGDRTGPTFVRPCGTPRPGRRRVWGPKGVDIGAVLRVGGIELGVEG